MKESFVDSSESVDRKSTSSSYTIDEVSYSGDHKFYDEIFLLVKNFFATIFSKAIETKREMRELG